MKHITSISTRKFATQPQYTGSVNHSTLRTSSKQTSNLLYPAQGLFNAS